MIPKIVLEKFHQVWQDNIRRVKWDSFKRLTFVMLSWHGKFNSRNCRKNCKKVHKDQRWIEVSLNIKSSQSQYETTTKDNSFIGLLRIYKSTQLNSLTNSKMLAKIDENKHTRYCWSQYTIPNHHTSTNQRQHKQNSLQHSMLFQGRF